MFEKSFVSKLFIRICSSQASFSGYVRRCAYGCGESWNCMPFCPIPVSKIACLIIQSESLRNSLMISRIFCTHYILPFHRQFIFLHDVTIYEGRLTSVNQSEKVSTDQTKALTNQQSKQPEKHSQNKHLPNRKTRIKIPTSGPLSIPMTNDYLFRALLQKNNHVLKGLVCSLLHLSPEEVRSVTITPGKDTSTVEP